MSSLSLASPGLATCIPNGRNGYNSVQSLVFWHRTQSVYHDIVLIKGSFFWLAESKPEKAWDAHTMEILESLQSGKHLVD